MKDRRTPSRWVWHSAVSFSYRAHAAAEALRSTGGRHRRHKQSFLPPRVTLPLPPHTSLPCPFAASRTWHHLEAPGRPRQHYPLFPLWSSLGCQPLGSSLCSSRFWFLFAILLLPCPSFADTGSFFKDTLFWGLLSLLLGALLLYASFLAYSRMKSSHRSGASSSPVATYGQTPFDCRLLDAVELPCNITMYFVKLGQRILLLASRDGSLVGLGDFPLSWALGEETDVQSAFRPSAAPSSPTFLPPVRDSVTWERQRRELIEALRREET
jgi:hypothetical protein